MMIREKIIQSLLTILLYKAPNIDLSIEEQKLCKQLYNQTLKSSNNQIPYHLSLPKYKFLYYLLHHESVLLHGSTNKNIHVFEPRDQTLFNGEMTKAIFATADPIWPFFYATLNKSKIDGNIRNGSISHNGKQWFHYYSLTRATLTNNPWTNGMIYILPKDHFTHVHSDKVQFNEWTSTKVVSPIAKLEVNPDDFYFLDKVATHKTDEKMLKTWFLYKIRTIFKSY